MKMNRLIWIPRGLIMAFALFTMLFSLDVFGGTEPIWKQLEGFIIHNIPFFVLSFILVATWKRPMIAGFLFIMAGIVLLVLFHTRWDWVAYLLISGTPMLVGMLFLAVHFLKRREHNRK